MKRILLAALAVAVLLAAAGAGVYYWKSHQVQQKRGSAKLACALDERLPDDCVRVAAGHPATANLGAMFGTVTVEKGA